MARWAVRWSTARTPNDLQGAADRKEFALRRVEGTAADLKALGGQRLCGRGLDNRKRGARGSDGDGEDKESGAEHDRARHRDDTGEDKIIGVSTVWLIQKQKRSSQIYHQNSGSAANVAQR